MGKAIKKYKKKCEERSAGVIIRRGDKILLLDRAFFPFGWACPAGHVKQGENFIQGIRRETVEETGLTLVRPRILFAKKRVKNKCIKGSMIHDWKVFEAYARGKLRRNPKEAKSLRWFSAEEIKKLKLEPVWRMWLKQLKIL